MLLYANMPYCHNVALCLTQALARVAKRQVRQISTSFTPSVVTSDTDHGPWSPQRSPGRCRPIQSPAPA